MLFIFTSFNYYAYNNSVLETYKFKIPFPLDVPVMMLIINVQWTGSIKPQDEQLNPITINL